mgnify:CR=1 FL=1
MESETLRDQLILLSAEKKIKYTQSVTVGGHVLEKKMHDFGKSKSDEKESKEEEESEKQEQDNIKEEEKETPQE